MPASSVCTTVCAHQLVAGPAETGGHIVWDVIEVDGIPDLFDLAAVLLGGTPRPAVAGKEKGLDRRPELFDLRRRGQVLGIVWTCFAPTRCSRGCTTL